MSESEKLQALRKRINELDEKIQQLISERGLVAKEVADAKLASGSATAFYRPEREAQVLRSVIERNQGPFGDEEIARLFREIMSACLALEQPMTIAYLGPEGTFTQAAALKHFGHSVSTLPMAAIDEVFREVESGTADYGVVPVENSTEGVVNHTLDMFMRSALKICGEVDIRVHQNLLSKNTDLAAINTVYSHQQSFAQCREWLDTHLPGVERITVKSNAEAARIASEQAGTAAIASEVAARLYDLTIVKANIEDDPDNTTRFLVIGKNPTPPSGADKTTLLVSARNKPGALWLLLQPFAETNISLTRIESRPSRVGMWEYVFFIDIDGHADDPRIAAALHKLEQESSMLKILGSYPKAVL
ncbi:MAG: prephenate dehydratase [Gammaproteobacteria bacterium SG8_11]|nr:MAG: prephenate dehydratase [Gammaproteobacteria bacterium SG8_11]